MAEEKKVPTAEPTPSPAEEKPPRAEQTDPSPQEPKKKEEPKQETKKKEEPKQEEASKKDAKKEEKPKKKDAPKKDAKKKADPKKKPKKKKEPPPPPTPEELKASAQLQIEGAALALDFRDQANFYRKAAQILRSIPNDPESGALADTYEAEAEEILRDGYREAYDQAAALEAAGHVEDYYQAGCAFRKIEEYQDAARRAEECERRYEKLSRGGNPGLVVALLILALLAAAVVAAQTPFGKYELGRVYLSCSRYADAMNQFKGLNGYRDSQALERESRYQLAVKHMTGKRYEKAVHHFEKLGDYKNSQKEKVRAERELLRTAAAGDEAQYAGLGWYVLERTQDRALLLQKNPVKEVQAYHSARAAVDWPESDACRWLNTDYQAKHFSPEELALLLPEPGAAADITLFLLTAEEAGQYAQWRGETEDNWWLRTPGETAGTTAFVAPDGTVMAYGYPSDDTEIHLRPAIRVNLSK